MRFKRNYLGVVKKGIGFLSSRFKPLSIHTEIIMDNNAWKEIQEKVRSKKVKVWHIMTPANYELYRTNFGIKLNKSEVSRKMKERYLWMKGQGENLQLHIHLSIIIKNMTYEDQSKLFTESLDWMKKELDIIPSEFVPGWWIYNDDTLKLCKKHNLKFIKERDYDYGHDYEWLL